MVERTDSIHAAVAPPVATGAASLQDAAVQTVATSQIGSGVADRQTTYVKGQESEEYWADLVVEGEEGRAMAEGEAFGKVKIDQASADRLKEIPYFANLLGEAFRGSRRTQETREVNALLRTYGTLLSLRCAGFEVPLQ